MAGEDEARARATLVEMLRRLSEGPNATLGVAFGATPEQVRAAFLALTKVFHPARFGRMAPEIQKLSNEVFLGIKGAHDTLLRSLGAPLRGAPGHANQSGAMPIVTAEGSSKVVGRGTNQQVPSVRASGTENPVRIATPAMPSPRAASPAARAPVTRPTPPQGVRIVPTPTGTGSTPPQGVRSMPTGAARPVTPNVARPPTPPAAPATKPAAPVDPDVQNALALIAARNFAAAEQTVNRLRARDWTSKQYRALQFYLRGREAESAGQSQEAAQAYDRALQLDPDQIHAKTALDELQRRR